MTSNQKYLWLVETLRRGGRMTMEELQNVYRNDAEMSDGEPLSRTTFNRWRGQVFSTLGLDIRCRKTNGRYEYYIANWTELEKDTLRRWMFDAQASGSLVSGNLGLRDRFVIDEVPSGREHLATIIDAMKKNCTVALTYQSYTAAAPSTFTVAPYCVRLFGNRWYVVGWSCGRGRIRMYALDRMQHCEVTAETFALPRDFDAAAYFRNHYGVQLRDGEPERIVVRAYDEHPAYMKSLPLHPSQAVVGETEAYTDFRFRLVPNDDFVMKLMSWGALVKVLEPAWLRNEIRRRAQEVISLYDSGE